MKNKKVLVFTCDYAFAPNASIALQFFYPALSSQAPTMEQAQVL
jgi:hypothetical protein